MLKIISGGQTGVDRAALDAALAASIPYGGWCPRGGWAEDAPTPPGVLARYPDLRETPTAAPEQRTEWNVRDSDHLMVLVDRHGLVVSKGTSLALHRAEERGKPYIVIDLDAEHAIDHARAFLEPGAGSAVCIAGPRESEAPGIYAKALALLTALLKS